MPSLRHTLAVCAAALSLSPVAVAQHSGGYVFAGASAVPGRSSYTYWHGGYLHAGAGGEGAISRRFTLGGEIGALISTAERFSRNAALLSFGPAFHFFPRSERKTYPFVAGGVSLLGSQGYGGMIYYGGGLQHWFRPHLGLRVEFRDHVSPDRPGVHFTGGRIGLSFR